MQIKFMPWVYRRVCPECNRSFSHRACRSATLKLKVKMKSFLLFIFGLLFFGFLALAAFLNPNLQEARAADPCQVSVSVGPTFVAGYPINIRIINAAPFTNYRVVIDEPRASNVYNQTRNSGPIVSGGSVLFPEYIPPIDGNYVFHGDNLDNGQNCSNSPKTVSVIPGGLPTDPCQVSVSVGPTFVAGYPINIRIINAAPFTNYLVHINSPTTSNVYNQTRNSGPIVSGGNVIFPDYTPPVEGNYSVLGVNLDNGKNCSNSPKTVSVIPGAQCILSSVNTTQIAGQPVNFTVSGLTMNNSYIVELIVENTDSGSKRVADAKTTTITGSLTEWTDTFDGNLFLEVGDSIIYSMIARQTSPTTEVCQNQNVHWTILDILQGENPCNRDINGDGIIDCETAIGNISTDIGKFAQKILSIGVGIAGGIALIIMVIGSIRVLTSGGDPKNVAGGREMIIAAVAGLLFLIFSVLILQFIGFDILRIPNFG